MRLLVTTFLALAMYSNVFAAKPAVTDSHLVTLNLHANAGKCELNEFGSAVISNPFTRKGKSGLGCEVKIPMAEFRQRFEFCALSGITIDKSNTPRFNCDMTVGDGEVTFYSFSEGITRPSCSFACVRK